MAGSKLLSLIKSEAVTSCKRELANLTEDEALLFLSLLKKVRDPKCPRPDTKASNSSTIDSDNDESRDHSQLGMPQTAQNLAAPTSTAQEYLMIPSAGKTSTHANSSARCFSATSTCHYSPQYTSSVVTSAALGDGFTSSSFVTPNQAVSDSEESPADMKVAAFSVETVDDNFAIQ